MGKAQSSHYPWLPWLYCNLMLILGHGGDWLVRQCTVDGQAVFQTLIHNALMSVLVP